MQRIEVNVLTGDQHIVELTPEEISEVLANQPVDTRTYAEKRAAEYPPITDYIDGVVKRDQAQIDKYIAECQAVKAKYPKSNV